MKKTLCLLAFACLFLQSSLVLADFYCWGLDEDPVSPPPACKVYRDALDRSILQMERMGCYSSGESRCKAIRAKVTQNSVNSIRCIKRHCRSGSQDGGPVKDPFGGAFDN